MDVKKRSSINNCLSTRHAACCIELKTGSSHSHASRIGEIGNPRQSKDLAKHLLSDITTNGKIGREPLPSTLYIWGSFCLRNVQVSSCSVNGLESRMAQSGEGPWIEEVINLSVPSYDIIFRR